jgi:NagD protein
MNDERGRAVRAREILAPIRQFVLDMDGTIYLGDELFPWTKPFLDAVEATGRDYLFLTNNSSRGAEDYVRKLARLGLPIPSRRMMTSGQATADLLRREPDLSRLWVMGTDELLAEFSRAGFELDPTDPQAVVMGFDTSLTYAKLELFCRLVREGRRYVATHPDFVCPTPRGPIPDIGGTIALVDAVCGRKPDLVVGKPNPGILEAASQRSGVPLGEIAVVGDRLYTDILGARDAGCVSVLVLSGEATRDDLATSEVQPDLVVSDLAELQRYL